MPAAVEFRNVTCVLGGRPILRELSLTIDAGETLVLLGRSGSGKTTALKLINGLLRPDQGAVLVNGTSTTAWDSIRLKRSIGYVIQEGGLFPHFTIARNIGLVPELERWDEPRARARVQELLTTVGLPADFAHRYPRQLSGGQRQRVGVARALAADPAILLLDEPFGALDPVTRSEIQRQFAAIVGQLHKTSVFVTHDLREASRLATRIGLLHNGRLEWIGQPDEFPHATTEEARAFLQCVE